MLFIECAFGRRKKKNIWPRTLKANRKTHKNAKNKTKTPKMRMRRVGKSQSSGGVLRVVALQDGAAAAAAETAATAATAATAHEARREGRGWLSIAKKAALVGSLGSLGVGAVKLARWASSGPLSNESMRDMQSKSTFDVIDAFDRQIQEEAAEEAGGEQAQRHSFGMESVDFDGVPSGPTAIEPASHKIAMFCASRVHDLLDIVDGQSDFFTLPLDAGTRYEPIARNVLGLILEAKKAEKLVIEADSAADFAALSALEAQITFLTRALRADDDGADFGSAEFTSTDLRVASDERYRLPFDDDGGSYIQPVDHKVPPVESRVLKNTVDNFAGSVVNYGHMATWDVRRVTDMSDAFGWTADNELVMSMCADLSFWDTRRVHTMARMFQRVRAFNGKIGTWHTANVSDMSSMFSVAERFNQPIAGWDVRSVATMEGMFLGATSFAQDISEWRVGPRTNIKGMFLLCPQSHMADVIREWRLTAERARDAGLVDSAPHAFGMRGKGCVGRAFV